MFIDIHLYTDRFSEPRVLPISQIHQSISAGLDGVVLVEKNRLWSSEDIHLLRREAAVPDNFLILRGQEIECPDGELIVIGCEEEFSNQITTFELKQRIRQQGGCSIFIPSKNQHTDLIYMYGSTKKDQTVNFHLFDAVEIYNSKLDRKMMRDFLDYARCRKIGSVAGSAAHTSALYVTKFFDTITNEKEAAQAVINKRTTPIFVENRSVEPRGGSTANINFNIPKVNLMKSKGLIFDLYGTLIDLKSIESHEEFNKTALWLSQEDIQVSGERLMKFYIERSNELYNNLRNKVKFPEVDILQVFRDAIHFFSGQDFGEEFARKTSLVFRSLTIKHIKLYPYARAILRELNRRHYRMGIISNAQAAFTLPELKDLKIEKFFDFIILSSDIGCSKPDSKIYQIASRQIELPPAETAFIGDDLIGDIYGAQNHGFKTVYIKTNVGTSDYPVIPDATLTDGDLRNLLRLFP